MPQRTGNTKVSISCAIFSDRCLEMKSLGGSMLTLYDPAKPTVSASPHLPSQHPKTLPTIIARQKSPTGSETLCPSSPRPNFTNAIWGTGQYRQFETRRVKRRELNCSARRGGGGQDMLCQEMDSRTESWAQGRELSCSW
jgi:hypothetical protein